MEGSVVPAMTKKAKVKIKVVNIPLVLEHKVWKICTSNMNIVSQGFVRNQLKMPGLMLGWTLVWKLTELHRRTDEKLDT